MWEPLNQGQRDILVNWLNQINQCDLTANNWLFFQVFVNLVNLGLRKFGVRYSREIMETALDKIEYSTLSDSWYSDGPTLQREFENPLYFTRCFTKLYSQSPTQAPVLRGVDLSIRDPQSISPALFCMLKPHEYFSCRTKKIIYIINIGN